MANEVDLVLKGGKIVTPEAVFAGSIAIENGRITAIAEDKTARPGKHYQCDRQVHYSRRGRP